MKKETILVTGGSGSLGTSLRNFSPAEDFTILAPPSSELNVTNYSQCADALRDNGVSVIIHSAAMTDWEACQKNPLVALAVNTVGTFNMARVAKENNVHLIVISSDAVFPGKLNVGGYNEHDTPNNPTSFYGVTKLAAELAARQNIMESLLLIVRLGWLFGPNPEKDNKFVGRIVRKLAQGETRIKAVHDKVGTLTYSLHAAEKIFSFVKNRISGCRHVVNGGIASRSEIAQYVVKLWKPDAEVESVSSTAFPSAVVRPDYAVLSSAYHDSSLPDWQTAMDHYHQRYPLSEFLGTSSL